MVERIRQVVASPLVVALWVLMIPWGFEIYFSAFVRESELNSRLGWAVAIAAVAWLSRSRLLSGLLLLPFLLTGVADMFYAYYFGGVFSTNTLDAVFNTDLQETRELIQAYLNVESLLIIAFYVGGFVWLVRQMQPEGVWHWPKRVVTGLGVLVLLFAVQQMVVKQRFYDILPGLLGIAPTYANNLEHFDQAVADYRRLVETTELSARLRHQEVPQTRVIIIGEAMTRTHMSLYGYPRKTTPVLDELRNELVVMTDVITPFVQTRPALNAVLFPQSWEAAELDYHRALSIANVARKAGYKVFWLSNQQPFRVPTHMIADTVDKATFITREVAGVQAHRHDDLLLPHLARALQDPAAHKLIFVHLMGSHLQYANRYPSEFAVFDGTPPRMVSEGLLPWQVDKINAYDNSIRYTDWLVGQIHQQVRQYGQGAVGWMLFSDHGEEVYETARLNGHTPDNLTRPMFTIPVMFWHNPVLRQQQSAMLEQLRANAAQPYMSDRLFETWVDWLDLDWGDCAGCQYSFLRPYTPRVRKVYGVDFDNRWPQ